jgi:HEAT repeat protein
MINPFIAIKVRRFIGEFIDNKEHAEIAIEGLALIGEPAIPQLVKALGHRWAPVAQNSARTLVAIGKPALPALIRALKSKGRINKDSWAHKGRVCRAAWALAELRDASAIPALIEVVNMEESPGRYSATEALSALYPRDALDLRALGESVRKVNGFEKKDRSHKEDMQLLIEAYTKWATYLSQVARGGHQDMQRPPRSFRNIQGRVGSRSIGGERMMAVGGRRA